MRLPPRAPMSRWLAAAVTLVCTAAGAVAAGAPAMELLEPARREQPVRVRAQASDSSSPAEATITAPGGKWDLSAFDSITMTAHNTSSDPLTVRARAENAGARGLSDNCRGAIVIMPAQRRQVRVRLTRRPEDPGYAVFEPFMMYFKALSVRDNTIDPSAVARIVVGFDATTAGQSIEVSDVRAEGEGSTGPVKFFPFVDRFGQYIHSDWPGKIHSAEDFSARRDEEAAERRDWPGPGDWDKYGGWAKGPQLKATGFFYPKKHDGKWWLVDPDGRLFWSYGPTGVGFGGDVTPITDREHWFRDLPSRDSQWKPFFREGRGATYKYYQKRPWLGYDVAAANLLQKYGPDYKNAVAELSHDRLRSWGFNSMGNWSAHEVYALKRTPYTVAIHYNNVPLIHYRMPDIYHPNWEPAVRASMEKQRGTTAGDPWNIGYFVDNERWWGWRPRAAAIGEETLKNPPDAPSKVKFVETLRAKYPTIAALNKSWGTQHASWDALLAHREPPDMENKTVLADCGDFGMAFAERYFSTVKTIVKDVAPGNMYLGVRFHGHVDVEVVKLCAKYTDLVSYNVYDNPPDGRVNQYARLDVPIMSTEWGIGSDPQQTPFRGADKGEDPAERVRLMTQYLDAAIRHPNMVGAHFFQYRDQPISGRPDGEATLRGFVNITDTPNFELVQANRKIAYKLYETRAKAGAAEASAEKR